MLSVSEELKTLYKTASTPKSFTIYYPSIPLTITNSQIVSGSFSIEESIVSDNDIKYGSCEASAVKFTVADISEDLTGLEFTVTQTVGSYEIPYGAYVVKSCEKQNNRRFKDIIAYDKMQKIDIDVASWYNGLTFPLTLATFRSSFLTYVGLTEDASKLPLPNDSMIITKTIEPAELPGRDVIEAIEEINGVFGHINRSGQFTHIILKPMYGLYPGMAYPSNTLYPVSETDTTSYPAAPDETVSEDMRESIRFEEYTVSAIDKLVIRSDDDDIGAIVGTGTNAYFITGNFLVFGKSATELETIAKNTSGYIFNRPYRPYESSQIGLPYVEVGDLLEFENSDTVKGYVFNRTLKGIQALQDDISATGSKETKQTTNVNKRYKVLEYKYAKMQMDVDGLSAEVGDESSGLIGLVNVMAGQVVLKVKSNGSIAAVELDADPETGTSIKLAADNISLEGLVTVNGKFKVLANGTIEAVDAKFSGTITASAISGSSFQQTGSQGTVTIQDGWIDTDVMTAVAIGTSSLLVDSSITLTGSTGTIQATNINGTNGNIGALTVTTIGNGLSSGSPIHAGNISGQSVNYATTAGSANNCVYATYANGISGDLYTDQIYATNTGYGNIDFRGFDNAAGVNWVQANFAPLNPSDFRLKCNILSLDNIPDELFYSLKVKQFNYKTPIYGEGICFGLIAQEVESAFQNHGLDPYAYDLIEVKDVRAYTDDGCYVEDVTHRIHYNNLIAWLISIVQKQNTRISQLEKL